LIACLFLPVVDAFLAFVIFLVAFGDGRGGYRWGLVDAAQSFAAGVFVVALPMSFAGALPTFEWLLKRGHSSFRVMVAAGILLGNVPYGLAVVINGAVDVVRGGTLGLDYILWSGPIGLVRALPMGTIIGFASGVLLWSVPSSDGHEHEGSGASAPSDL
jgi:hypothetical protein